MNNINNVINADKLVEQVDEYMELCNPNFPVYTIRYGSDDTYQVRNIKMLNNSIVLETKSVPTSLSDLPIYDNVKKFVDRFSCHKRTDGLGWIVRCFFTNSVYKLTMRDETGEWVLNTDNTIILLGKMDTKKAERILMDTVLLNAAISAGFDAEEVQSFLFDRLDKQYKV